MKNKILFLIINAMLLLALPIHAEESLQKWGKLNFVSANNITIESDDPEDKDNPNFTFSFSSQIVLEGINSVSELKKGEFIIVEYTIDKKGRFDAQKITASGRLGDWLQQERKAQTNEGDEIKKMWQEIRNIKQKLGMQ